MGEELFYVSIFTYILFCPALIKRSSSSRTHGGYHAGFEPWHSTNFRSLGIGSTGTALWYNSLVHFYNLWILIVFFYIQFSVVLLLILIIRELSANLYLQADPEKICCNISCLMGWHFLVVYTWPLIFCLSLMWCKMMGILNVAKAFFTLNQD